MTHVRKSAFTLFELLVTMAVVSIVVGTGFYTIARSTNDRALERAADTLHSMVRIARTQAITNGVHARVIINADSSDPDSYLRRIGVMLEDASGTGKWLAIDRGAFLPEGVFVVPQDGQVVFSADWPVAGRRSIYKRTGNDAVDSAVYHYNYPLKEPVLDSDSLAPAWICIQFAPNGRLSTVHWGGSSGLGDVPSSNLLVLAHGAWSGGKVGFRDREDVLAIAFKLSGESFLSDEASLVD